MVVAVGDRCVLVNQWMHLPSDEPTIEPLPPAVCQRPYSRRHPIPSPFVQLAAKEAQWKHMRLLAPVPRPRSLT